MSKLECGLERRPRQRYVIAVENRFGQGWDVEQTEDPVKMAARRTELKRKGRTHRVMREWLYPCSYNWNGEWETHWETSRDREVISDYIHPKQEALVPKVKVPFTYNDGGRQDAGYKGSAGDCVVRSIAIAAQRPYQEVYDAMFALRIHHAATRRDRTARSIKRKGNSPRNGNPRKVYEKYLSELGWKFVPTMSFGSGCKVHLRPDELPSGRIIARVSKHLVAVIDGVIHDTFDPSRKGTRCVYGYYEASNKTL